MIFINRPISAITLGIALLLLLSNFLPYIKKRRQKYEEFEE
jgi:TctA family transporter